jgi:hypothetical protein
VLDSPEPPPMHPQTENTEKTISITDSVRHIALLIIHIRFTFPY